MRVVFDANIYVSGFISPKGPSGLLIKKFINDNVFELIISEEILRETRNSLKYKKVIKYVKLSGDEIELILNAISLLATTVNPVFKYQELEEDPDDTKYVNAALEGRADYIISGDKHLLGLVEVEGIKIVTARAFLKLI
ncbi:MAG: putative toxin-antitoxin system toxin component, PIN family [Deltaproteobacteria bacterium RIFCSPHIGHO2_12_FULL_43_9]|nr:MAG: putative toxin-antitoxin system toxin component, PIN family [Deltaproteobacteria bacterium RIFCSPHIGHO2_12_FULL_43_9]